MFIVYVDDIIITSGDEGEIQRLKKKLAQDFEIKDLETLKYFLGWILLDQRKVSL